MKNALIAIVLLLSFANVAHADEKSECDGMSSWKRVNQNSSDILMRTCNVFGMNYVEIKSQLSENRCIFITNTQTGDQWKRFYLHKQSIKALGNPYIDPTDLAITSKSPEKNRCYS